MWWLRVTESGSGRGLTSDGEFRSLVALFLPTPKLSPHWKPNFATLATKEPKMGEWG